MKSVGQLESTKSEVCSYACSRVSDGASAEILRGDQLLSSHLRAHPSSPVLVDNTMILRDGLMLS
jgi:hypothetical protein